MRSKQTTATMAMATMQTTTIGNYTHCFLTLGIRGSGRLVRRCWPDEYDSVGSAISIRRTSRLIRANAPTPRSVLTFFSSTSYVTRTSDIRPSATPCHHDPGPAGRPRPAVRYHGSSHRGRKGQGRTSPPQERLERRGACAFSCSVSSA